MTGTAPGGEEEPGPHVQQDATVSGSGQSIQAGRDVHIHPAAAISAQLQTLTWRSRVKDVRVWILGLAVATVLTSVLVYSLGNGVSHGTGTGTALPFAWSVRLNKDLCGGASPYLVVPALPEPAADPLFGPVPSRVLHVLQSAPVGQFTDVITTFQGKSDTVTVLQALRITVVNRAKPAGTAILQNTGCGGLQPRYFGVDLDRPTPRAVPSPGISAGTPIAAVGFPFRISGTDPEVFHVYGATRTCDCQWTIQIDWTSGSRSGTVTINDNGRPFHTVGIAGLSLYSADQDPGSLKTFWQKDASPAGLLGQ